MAAGFISEPGTEYGPCAKTCKHIDCIENRCIAATTCKICGKPIGYRKRFYQERSLMALVHAICGYKMIEDEQRKAKKQKPNQKERE